MRHCGDERTGIPRLAFSIWYQGADAAPPAVRAVLESNKAMAQASGWSFRVFDGASLRAACVACGVGEAYDAYKHMHQRIDLGRLCLLYLHGGVSVDADQRFVKPFEALPHLDSGVPVLSEVICRSTLCHRVLSFGARRLVNNALIMSPARSPHMLAIARRIAGRQRLRLGNAMMDVMITTGPVSVSHAVSDMIRDGRVRVMPAKIVEPCSLAFVDVMNQAFAGVVPKCAPFKSTVAVHPYTMSWLKPMSNMKLLAAVLLLCCCVLFLKKRKK